MKTIIAVAAAVAALSGCAVQQPGYYATTTRVQDPYQWHTVAVAPSDRAYASGSSTTYYEDAPAPSSRVVYAEPVYTTTYIQPAPVYYAPAPAYYYPPVSIGLDFSFGHWCCGGRWGGRGYHRR
ncbi:MULTISPECIES: hypothetical protein [unclassified Duganella]|uniref:hypothetical protein n=1 Tax=unclassified Duganella TaxID=2636909 RepID=UPI000E348A52|nr:MULTISPECIES: hypothetical protein [unclassified Duganella]RFP08961.1 hypothetical protein D0T23_27660 [Duganella sp. BJB475]RFP23928.1 hypothetical protein D0T21_28665 [Duganella sp. BJB476]